MAALTSEALVEMTHNSFALVGLAIAFAFLTLSVRPDLREAGEQQLLGWLHSRQSPSPTNAESEVVERTTAADPRQLPRDQAAVAQWLSRKYRVAPEPMGALVAAAWEAGERARIEPTLLLALAAVESGFNPFAQGPVGAQGVMQIPTGAHADKFEGFGGRFAVFDPISNLRVGTRILQESVERGGGSIDAGLKRYLAAIRSDGEPGSTERIFAEQARLRQIVQRAGPANPAPHRDGVVRIAALGSQ